MAVSLDVDAPSLRGSIMNLALPATMQMFLQTLAGIVTQIVVGHLGAVDIAGVGLANRYLFLLMGVLSAVSVGNTALVARYTGAGDSRMAHRVLAQSLVSGLMAGVLLAVSGILTARPFLVFLTLGRCEPEVIAAGTLYLKIIFASMILNLPMLFVNGALQGAGDTKTPLIITVSMNIVEVALSYPLTYGLGPWPGHGLAGAAMAQGIARVAGGLLAIMVILHPRLGKMRLTRDLPYKPDWRLLRGILQIGVPAAGEQMAVQFGQIVYTMMVSGLGTVAIASNQLVMTIQQLSFMPGMGFGVAATTLVGQALGAGKPESAEQFGWRTNRYAAYFMGSMGVIFFFGARLLAAIFTSDSAVRALTAYCLHIMAFSQIPFSVLAVLNGGLRGAGDTRYVMYITSVGQWGIRLVLSLLLGLWAGWGLPGFWTAMFIDVLVRAALVILRFRSGTWKSILAFKATAAT